MNIELYNHMNIRLPDTVVGCEPLGAGVSILSQFYLYFLLFYRIILQYHTISLHYPYAMMVEPIPNGRACIKL